MNHATHAAEFTRDKERAHWHDNTLWFVRTKRDKAAQSLPEWETLRETAGAIKAHTMSRLADYLEEFERAATLLGAQVHWAADAKEHNRIVLDILQGHAALRVVKSKSMLTEECHLNPFLEQHGIEVIDTDLGERIVQLAGTPPSHIVLPAIHLKKEDVGQLFHEHLGTAAGASDPKYLAEVARGHLRDKFMRADAGITGVNFAVAETGGFVVCTNEGNADLGVSLPKLHIASMGIEKLIPRAKDLGVFLRLLARSATGQPITTYSSHFHGPRPGGELHIVLVDNGRSELLGSDDFRRSLHCIRCGACMNTCPVYRRSGGFSYQSTVPGPIGSILAPARDPAKYHSLPFACSLCGSCTDVCPVKIDLHHQLLTWRGEIARGGHLPLGKRVGMKLGSVVLRRPWLYTLMGNLARRIVPHLPRLLVYNRWNPWGRQRELPSFPAQSFRQQYGQRHDESGKNSNGHP
ncbi:MAG TPA: lactate utilization protein B [Pirellulales bacterium]|jgi:L-lactate dehydrogenase complex protein LldF|nr:lactate utilization protein B [Pirellulales bacterium]